jgi:hypothetical protein
VVTGGDKMLALRGLACSVMLCSEGIGVGLRLDTGIESDLMRRGRVRSLLTYADAVARA